MISQNIRDLLLIKLSSALENVQSWLEVNSTKCYSRTMGVKEVILENRGRKGVEQRTHVVVSFLHY